MEDVRIGRDTATVEHIVLLTNASLPVIDHSRERTKLVIYPPLSGTLTLSIANPVIAGRGIILPAASPPIVMNVETHGDAVTKQWYGIHSVGNVRFTWYEGILAQR